MYNEQYLNNLINNKVEENINLDYKASGALLRNDPKVKEISKDVSAFANSAGGIIIYGIEEDPQSRHIPSSIDPIDRLSISKEWLEQIIQGNIQPRIDGLIIHPIEIGNVASKVVYLVEIPKSHTAHQANDKKYYKRFNFNSEPMYDYEIRDVMNRTNHPIMDLQFLLENYANGEDDSCYYLRVTAVNKGVVMAKYVNCDLTLSTACLYDFYDEYDRPTINLQGDNTVQDVLGYGDSGARFSGKRYQPILPQMTCELSFKSIALNSNYNEYAIHWTIFADNASLVKGTIDLRQVKVNYM